MFIAALLLAVSQPKATHDDYKSTIAVYDKYSSKLGDDSFWSKMVVERTDEKKMLFSDLTLAERDMFIIMFAKKLTKEGSDLQKAWLQELIKFKDDSYKSSDKNIAGKDDVDKYCKQLLHFRRILAVQLEKLAESMIKRLASEAEQYELQDLMKGIRKYHDSIKIIERK